MGGNIFTLTEPIKKEHIGPTLDKFKEELSKIFPKISFDFITLGSAGKKDISGDIDLGLNEDLVFDKDDEVKLDDWDLNYPRYLDTLEVIKKRSRTSTLRQNKMYAICKLICEKIQTSENIVCDPKNARVGTLFCQFPQYDKDGKELDDNVQIDINIGDLDWLKFSYYSESYEGNVKGLHRTQLLVALFANKKRTFRHGTGVWNPELGEYEAKTPSQAIKLLNKLYGIELTYDITKNFFDLYDYIDIEENIGLVEFYNIIDIYLKILDSTRTDIPFMLQDYWLRNKERLGLQGKFLPEESNLYENNKI